MKLTWEVVIHWTDDNGRHWADTASFTSKPEAILAFQTAQRDNHEVPGITVDVVERDEKRFPKQLTSWTTTPTEPAPSTPLGTIIGRLAARKRLKITDG